MFKKLACALFIAAAVAAAPRPSLAGQPPANAQQMATLQYLVGTWHCTWQSGNRSGSEDQVFAPALDGAWLEEREIVSVGGERAVRTVHYTGYDPQLQRYVHIGPDADGSYELAESPDGDVWSSADGSFVHTKVSDVERKMVETAGTGSNAAQLSMTCTKAAT